MGTLTVWKGDKLLPYLRPLEDSLVSFIKRVMNDSLKRKLHVLPNPLLLLNVKRMVLTLTGLLIDWYKGISDEVLCRVGYL